MIWDVIAQAITDFPSEVGEQERRTARQAVGPEDTAGSRWRGHVTDRTAGAGGQCRSGGP